MVRRAGSTAHCPACLQPHQGWAVSEGGKAGLLEVIDTRFPAPRMHLGPRMDVGQHGSESQNTPLLFFSLKTKPQPLLQ